MKIYVYPYMKGSQSAKLLVEHMGGMLIKLKGSKFKWNKPVVNWGNKLPLGNCLNKNPAVATNKIKTFELLKAGNVPHVPWTTDKAEAMKWVNAGKTVMARTKVASQGGAGIVVLNDHPATVAPLYTQYVKKRAEYRTHVVNDKVIHVQEKKKKHGHEHSLIQSHDNGYVFGKPGEVPQSVLDAGIGAVKALGLDFGAVDVIWNEHQGKAYVLEVNTAPGLSPQTAEKYANAFKEFFNA